MDKQAANRIVLAAVILGGAFVYGIGQMPKVKPWPGPYQIKTLGTHQFKLNTQTGETWYSGLAKSGLRSRWLPLDRAMMDRQAN